MAYKEELQANNVDLQNILDMINSLPEGGGEPADPELQSKTVTPTTSQQVIEPDAGYDGLDKVTVNAMPTATQATPSISVSSGGLITASSEQSAGYVTAGTKSATKQLTTQAAKTVIPSTGAQTAVGSGVYTTGAVTVAPIPEEYQDVTAETTAYTNLLPTLESVINSLPDAGSGGSGGVDTCTIKLQEGSQIYFAVGYTNGDMEYVYSDAGLIDGETNEITNVACGTIIYLSCNEGFTGITLTGANTTIVASGIRYQCIALNEVPNGAEILITYDETPI